MSVVEQSATGTSGLQHHVGVAPSEVSEMVLLPGDPTRVQLTADRPDDPGEVAHRREPRTVTGTDEGRLVTACSSGMGWPSTAVGGEELARAGARVSIRVGSAAARQPQTALGDLVVSEGTRRDDGTSAACVPAVPDLPLVLGLLDVPARSGPSAGSVCTPDPTLRSRPDQRLIALAGAALVAVGVAGQLVAPSLPLFWLTLAGSGSGGTLVVVLSPFGLRTGGHGQAAASSGMAPSVGCAMAAGGPVLIDLGHDATGSWSPPLVIVLGVLAVQAGAAATAARDRGVG